MAKCNKCGKRGFFLKLNSSGVCIDCERIEKLRIETKTLEDNYNKN